MSNETENNAAPEEERANTPEAAQEDLVPAISPGKTLAQRREELNLTVEQVAGQLNLAPRQIEAIETDNFAALPGMAIARGFVRSYAKLVGVDAEPLLAAMAPAVAPMPQSRQINQTYIQKSPSGDRLSFGERGSKGSKTLWIVLGVVAAGVAIAAAMQVGTGGGRANDGEATVATPAAQAERQDGRTVEVLPAPELPAESSPAPPEAAPSAPQPGAQAAPSAAQTVVAASATAPVQPEPAAAAAAVDEKNALVLRMREQSWVEIKRNDGAVIAARIFDAGAVEAVPLKGEMLVVVGNASGVDASLRGEALDLQTKARANVARINVK